MDAMEDLHNLNITPTCEQIIVQPLLVSASIPATAILNI